MSRRLIGVFAAFLFLCSVCYFRVFALATSPQLKEAAGSQGSVSLTAVSGRGDIFDRNGEKLVNVAPAYKVVLTPEQALQNYILLKDEVDSTDALEAGMQGTKPFVLSLSRRLKDDSLLQFVDYSRYEDNQSAAHIVGYLNGGKGVSGIEKAYDSLLAEGGYTATVSMQVSGMGTVIEGRPPQVEERQGQASVTLTLDKRIQQIAEQAMKDVDKGAVIVSDLTTGELLAVVSKPVFDPNALWKSLTDEDKPFVNRAFSGFNVGSTFKIVVAAAALQSGIDPSYAYTCTGSIDVDGQVYNCLEKNGHGTITMLEAVEHSCNTYFIDLGLKVGYDKVYAMARALGFGQGTEFAPGLSSAEGNLPLPSELPGAAQVANVVFGQGSLLATPVQIGNLFSACGTGGTFITPTLVKSMMEDGVTTQVGEAQRTTVRCFDESTAAQLRELLIASIEHGSGILAKPERGTAGGKTGSAQTGQYDENGNEIVHAWFGGFYEWQDGRYGITVLVEGGGFGGNVAAPIFKTIADGIAELEPA